MIGVKDGKGSREASPDRSEVWINRQEWNCCPAAVQRALCELSSETYQSVSMRFECHPKHKPSRQKRLTGDVFARSSAGVGCEISIPSVSGPVNLSRALTAANSIMGVLLRCGVEQESKLRRRVDPRRNGLRVGLVVSHGNVGRGRRFDIQRGGRPQRRASDHRP